MTTEAIHRNLDALEESHSDDVSDRHRLQRVLGEAKRIAKEQVRREMGLEPSVHMTSAVLRDVLESSEFRADLDELSAYLASIMQERPIVCLIAKYLWRLGYKLELEANRCDLVVDDKIRMEFKFNFNRCEGKLRNELKRFDHDLKQLRSAAQSGKLHKSWGVAAKIIRDVCDDDKRPDIFVWIICSRDLSKLSDADLRRVVVASEQCKYNAGRPYNSDGESLVVVDQFLELLRSDRGFTLHKLDIGTNRQFPSTYHFRICEFAK
jgi:hypothetical protein